MPSFRKKPVVVEAWTVRELNRCAQHDWYALPQCIRDDYESKHPKGQGAWVFGALVEDLVCASNREHGPHDKSADFCSQCGDAVLREGRRGIFVPTLEGNLFAAPGDWIIRGVQGEFYPCKPDIFAATYEEVPPHETATVSGTWKNTM